MQRLLWKNCDEWCSSPLSSLKWFSFVLSPFWWHLLLQLPSRHFFYLEASSSLFFFVVALKLFVPHILLKFCAVLSKKSLWRRRRIKGNIKLPNSNPARHHRHMLSFPQLNIECLQEIFIHIWETDVANCISDASRVNVWHPPYVHFLLDQKQGQYFEATFTLSDRYDDPPQSFFLSLAL